MEDIICSSKDCDCKAEYHNDKEDSYYCEKCAYTLFNAKECIKFGSISIIHIMMDLCMTLLDRLRDYVKEEQLELKWSEILEQMSDFEAEIEEISYELESILNKNQPKHLYMIQKRSINLKLQIIESEVYKRYLLHKDMNELRKRDGVDANKMTSIIDKEITETNTEEQKSSEERTHNFDKLYSSILSINQELEEYKKKHSEEIQRIKRQQLDDKELYEKEKEEWLAQRAEIEQELYDIKNKPLEISEELPNISYEVFCSLYKNFISKTVTLNLASEMAFDLQKVKWINLLKSLAKFRLPRIRCIKLDAVPSDSEVVKAFIKNSIPIQNQFDFNVAKQVQIKGSIYLEALKSAASKTYDVLNIHNTELSSQEFCEIVSAGRYCKKLQFCFDLITFDEMCDFKGDMNGCKIEYLYLLSSGSSDYSDWSNHPQRFKNLIAAIAKCAPLSKSLKVLNISKCEISKTRVIEICNNYNLIALRIIL